MGLGQGVARRQEGAKAGRGRDGAPLGKGFVFCWGSVWPGDKIGAKAGEGRDGAPLAKVFFAGAGCGQGIRRGEGRTGQGWSIFGVASRLSSFPCRLAAHIAKHLGSWENLNNNILRNFSVPWKQAHRACLDREAHEEFDSVSPVPPMPLAQRTRHASLLHRWCAYGAMSDDGTSLTQDQCPER